MPLTLEEYERLGFTNVEEFVDFDRPNRVPFFMACRSLTNSIKSFRPKLIRLTFFNSKVLSRSVLDTKYLGMLTQFGWFKMKESKSSSITEHEWMPVFQSLVQKMKRFTKRNPFERVEFISFSTLLGRNYYSEECYTIARKLESVLDIIPSAKYVLLNFSPHIHYVMAGKKLKSTTIIHVTPTSHCSTIFSRDHNLFFSVIKEYNANGIPIATLKEIIPCDYPTNIEIFLYNSIISDDFEESEYIVNNFKLDINLFSYIWNIRSYLEVTEIDTLQKRMDILNMVFLKYPSFRLFKIAIHDLKHLKLILSYPFVDINIGKNITDSFISNIKDFDSLSKEYNIDFTKLGNYKFSAGCFSKEFPNRNTSDINGVTLAMINYEDLSNQNLYATDKFGNNYLHYYIARQRFHNNTTNISITEDTKILSQTPNIYGITPSQLAVMFQHRSEFEGFNLIFNVEWFKDIYYSTRLLFIDGLMINEKILYASMKYLKDTPYDYSEFKDINYRDSNGKHLCHYSPFPFTKQFSDHLEIPLKDLIFCKDKNQTMCIQTVDSIQKVLRALEQVQNLPKINFISHTDDFGMFRFLYSVILSYGDSMIADIGYIGFDYSSDQPELVSLFPHYSNGYWLFSIEKSSLKQLKNVHYFGTVDGDDISHFILRYYLLKIRNYPKYDVDTAVLKALIAKGLLFDIVKNSKGQTAFDLLSEFDQTKQTPRILTHFKELIKICKQGLSNNSKAKSTFSIIHKVPKELIVESTENSLILDTPSINNLFVKLKRKLFFEQKERPMPTNVNTNNPDSFK